MCTTDRHTDIQTHVASGHPLLNCKLYSAVVLQHDCVVLAAAAGICCVVLCWVGLCRVVLCSAVL
jgi:hypothetical protein